MGQKSAENLIQQIEKSKSNPFSRVLVALSIRHVGSKTAKILAARFESFAKLKQATIEELSEINEIGPIIAQSVYDFFHTERNELLITNYELLSKNYELRIANYEEGSLFEKTPLSPLPTLHSPLKQSSSPEPSSGLSVTKLRSTSSNSAENVHQAFQAKPPASSPAPTPEVS